MTTANEPVDADIFKPFQHDRRTGVVNATARFRTYFKRVRAERARNLEVGDTA